MLGRLNHRLPYSDPTCLQSLLCRHQLMYELDASASVHIDSERTRAVKMPTTDLLQTRCQNTESSYVDSASPCMHAERWKLRLTRRRTEGDLYTRIRLEYTP